MADIRKVVMTVKKWKVRPNPPEWVIHSTRTVECKVTAKRVMVISGMDRGKVFDRATGQEIRARGFSWFQHSIQPL